MDTPRCQCRFRRNGELALWSAMPWVTRLGHSRARPTVLPTARQRVKQLEHEWDWQTARQMVQQLG